MGAAALAAIGLGGCETLSEGSLLSRNVVIDGDGFQVVEDLKEDLLGAQHVQYTAINYENFPFCAQVRLDSVSFSSGYSLGGIYKVPPNGSVDIGYINLPASYDVTAETWNTQDDGECGYPPN
jgi:hypothetical protein